MIAISKLTDDQLLRLVRVLRLAGYVPEREFYAECIHAALGEAADVSKACNAVTERFFDAVIERQLTEIA